MGDAASPDFGYGQSFTELVVIEAFEIIITAAAVYFIIDQMVQWRHQ